MSTKSFQALASEIDTIRARFLALSDKLDAFDIESIEVTNHRSGDSGLELLAAYLEACEKAWRAKSTELWSTTLFGVFDYTLTTLLGYSEPFWAITKYIEAGLVIVLFPVFS